MSCPIVEVEQGKLQGKEISKNHFVFKGIPYAKPPVGNLRFSVSAANFITHFSLIIYVVRTQGSVVCQPKSSFTLPTNLFLGSLG